MARSCKKKNGLKLHWVNPDENGVIKLEDVKQLFELYPISIVSFVHTSNTLGTIQPLKDLFKFCKTKNAVTIS